jgi:hypothetical protein
MNYTKEFADYVSLIKNTIPNKYSYKCDKYGALDKCTRILRQITEEEKNIENFDRSKIILT